MRLCAISFKECWPDASGRWYSTGGFPLQMAAIGALFPEMELVVARTRPQPGGLPLPAHARVTAFDPPVGDDLRRKLSLAARLPLLLPVIVGAVRRADVVHTPLPGDVPLLALVASLAMRRHTIARYCGSWESTPDTTVAERLTRGLLRVAAGGRNVMLATGDGPVPPAPGMSWIFATALSRAELDSCRPDLDRPRGAPPALAFVGRLAAEKGCDALLRAVSALATVRPTVTFIGEGEERPALERLVAELQLGERVRFTGQLDRERLGAELARADLCVQPSRTEGFSKAWLDAMAYGVPVLATRTGAAATVVGESGERGWLVPPGDGAALHRTLEAALSSPDDWPALRRRCRQFAETRTLEAWGARIADQCRRQWGASAPGNVLAAS